MQVLRRKQLRPRHNQGQAVLAVVSPGAKGNGLGHGTCKGLGYHQVACSTRRLSCRFSHGTTPDTAASPEFAKLQHTQGHQTEHWPGNVLTRRERRGVKEHPQGWQVMQSQL